MADQVLTTENYLTEHRFKRNKTTLLRRSMKFFQHNKSLCSVMKMPAEIISELYCVVMHHSKITGKLQNVPNQSDTKAPGKMDIVPPVFASRMTQMSH